MGSNPSERKHSSYPCDLYRHISSLKLDDDLEPPVVSGRAPHPQIESTTFGDAFDGHRQSESLAITPHQEVQHDRATIASGQGNCNDCLESNSEGPSTSHNLWDGIRESMVSINRLRRERISGIEKPHVCVICYKSFQYQSYLKRHILVHTAEKLFPCIECGNTFQTKANLKKHSLLHTGERPFKCTECDKSFQSKGNLKNHSVVHTIEKAYSCTECGKSFRRKGNLKEHYLMHSTFKYYCDFCPKTFTSPSLLKQHLLIVHFEVKPFACDICTQTFALKAKLEKHKRIDKCGKALPI